GGSAGEKKTPPGLPAFARQRQRLPVGCFRGHAHKHKQRCCCWFFCEVPAHRKAPAAPVHADPRGKTRGGGRKDERTGPWIAARRSFLASTSPGRTKPPGRTQSSSRTFGHVIMPTPPIHSTDKISHSRNSPRVTRMGEPSPETQQVLSPQHRLSQHYSHSNQ